VPEAFAAGRAYRLVYDIVPVFIGAGSMPRGDFCLRTPVVGPETRWLDGLRTAEDATLLLSVGESPYRDDRPLRTSYAFRTFYQGAEREGLPACLPPPTS